MTRFLLRIFVVGGVLVFAASAQQKSCDRECLRSMMTQYLNALVAHKPSAVPTASSVRFTENTVEMKLGGGLWKNASALRPYRQDILDVRQGVAGSHVIVEADGMPVMLLTRLKVVDRKITEIETQVTRNREDGTIFQPDALTTPTTVMNELPKKHVSREEMIRAAVFYPRGLKIGNFVTVDAPFAKDAYRFENGRMMAGKGCDFQPPSCEDIKGQTIRTHPTITYRVAAVDEELGITWLRMNFGVRSAAPGKQETSQNELIVWEAFKVHDGQIHAVEAFMRNMPAGSGSGWDAIYPPQTPQ